MQIQFLHFTDHTDKYNELPPQVDTVFQRRTTKTLQDLLYE